MCITGAGLSGRQTHRTQGVFNHTEDYVLLPDERTVSLCCWDSRTAERKNLLSLGHNNIVRCIVHSPTNPGFMTCSDDFRARFWYRRTTTDWAATGLHLGFRSVCRKCLHGTIRGLTDNVVSEIPGLQKLCLNFTAREHYRTRRSSQERWHF